MARVVIRCPICKGTMSTDTKKKSCRCPLCKNRLSISECEVVIPPEEDSSYRGKGFHNHYFLGFFIIFLGFLGVDFFIKKRVRKGIIAILICWTGVSMIQAIFRAFDVFALDDIDIDDYYKNLK